MKLDKKYDTYISVFLFFIVIVTRLPFITSKLASWDSVNFALAIERYDVSAQRPHPPGYILYVYLGKLINLIFNNPNTSFIIISLLFSGLMVVVLYYLGNILFNRPHGLIAALLLTFSPTFWSYGEVALSYVVEGFFSVLIAYFCYKLISGDDRYLLASAVILAIGGGVRQSTIIYLLPLWVYSIKKYPLKKIVMCSVIFTIITLSWFIPMVEMSGGLNKFQTTYFSYTSEAISPNTVFTNGFSSLTENSLSLSWYMLKGVLLGALFIVYIFYIKVIEKKKVIALTLKQKFLLIWILPSILFFILIQIPFSGYTLILLPAFALAASTGLTQFSFVISNLFKNISMKYILSIIIILIISTNTLYFLKNENIKLRNNERFINELSYINSNFPTNSTIVLTERRSNPTFNHAMYYLPSFLVYSIDLSQKELIYAKNHEAKYIDINAFNTLEGKNKVVFFDSTLTKYIFNTSNLKTENYALTIYSTTIGNLDKANLIQINNSR